MAKNWSAYEAAKELYGTNKENIEEIGSRYPLFTRTVAMANNPFVLDLLSAIPKVTARVVETGLKANQEDIVDAEAEEVETEEAQEEKPVKKASAKKTKAEPEDEESSDYESMSAKDLYALCCKRGISSLCKSRKKEALIELLEKLDNGEIEPAKKKATAKAEPKKTAKSAKKAEPEEAEDEDWDDEEEETDPYAGKSAKELYKMCVDRGIKTQPKQKPEKYAELLKKADAEAEESEGEDWDEEEAEDDDEWEI